MKLTTIDTIKVRITLDLESINKIEALMKEFNGIDRKNNNVIYKFIKGDLVGSHDSNISIVRFAYNQICVSCSLPKIIYGNNIINYDIELRSGLQILCDILEYNYNVEMPDIEEWELMRIDLSINYDMQEQWNVKRYINALQMVNYPRRKVFMYEDECLYIAGSTTTIKFYNKYQEFLKHDYKKLRKLDKVITLKESKNNNVNQFAISELNQEYGEGLKALNGDMEKAKTYLPDYYKKRKEIESRKHVEVTSKSANLLKIAEKVMRIEVEIKNRKIKDNFDSRMLKDIQYSKLEEIFVKEVEKVMKYKVTDMKIYSKSEEVERIIFLNCSTRLASALFSTWMLIQVKGYKRHRDEIKSDPANLRRFQRHIKKLKDLKISIHDSDINVIKDKKKDANFDVYEFNLFDKNNQLKDII